MPFPVIFSLQRYFFQDEALMSGSGHSENLKDPCGDFGPDQRYAVVWFFAVIIIGLAAVFTFRNTDAYNYATNGEFYDYAKFRANRVSQTHIASDGVDERSNGNLSHAVNALGQ